jgi:hypothetical protein
MRFYHLCVCLCGNASFFIINVFVCVNSSLGGSEGRGTTYNAFLEVFSFRSVCSEKSTMVGL